MWQLWKRRAGAGQAGKREVPGWSPLGLVRGTRGLVEAAGWLAGLAVVCWFAGEAARCRWQTIQEVDTRGYFEIAKSFAAWEWPRWDDEFGRFRGHVWVDPEPLPEEAPVPAADAPRPVLAKYSPGWPLCLAVGYWLNGAHGALWVNPVLAALGMLVFFLLARELAGAWPAALCTFLWATSPMLLMYSTYPLGHGPELTCTLLALFCVLRWAKTGGLRWALPAGFCAGFLPLIRPTTVLLWPGLVLAFIVAAVEHSVPAAGNAAVAAPGAGARSWRALLRLARERLGRWRWRRLGRALLGPAGWPWLAFAVAFLLPLVFLGLHNQALFGRLLRSGYFFTGEERAFDFGWLAPALNRWLGSTWSGGTGPDWIQARWDWLVRERYFVLENRFWLLALAGFLLRLRRPGMAWVFALLCVPNLLLYVSYYFFISGPVFYRFLFPTLPLFILGIAFLLDGWVRRLFPLQLVLVLIAFAWLRADPPRYFLRRAQVARGEHHDQRLFPWNSPQARDPLTGGLSQARRPMRTRDLEPWLQPGPVTIYAPAARQWEVAIYPGVAAFDADAWFSPRWDPPRNPRREEWHGVWGDKARSRRIHAQMAALGPAGRQVLFRAQVDARLARGEPVRLLLEDQAHPLRAWAEANPAWRVTELYRREVTPEQAREGLTPVWLLEVRPAPAPAEASADSAPAGASAAAVTAGDPE